MVEINNKFITLTRGDTAIIELIIYDYSENIYEMQEGDNIVFSIGTLPNVKDSLFLKKTFTDNIIKLDSKDTMYIKPGLYYFECEIFFNNGENNTICEGLFQIIYSQNN